MFAKWIPEESVFFFSLNDNDDGSVEISKDRHAEVIAAAASGKVLLPDADGHPTINDAPPPTTEVLTGNALRQRDELLRQAAIRIAPLQDAVDLGMATESEETLLISWKRYRVDLNRITNIEGFPTDFTWPVQPQGE